VTGRTFPTPSVTERGRASRSSKMRLLAPSPFIIVPKKEVSPINDDPMLLISESVSSVLYVRKRRDRLERVDHKGGQGSDGQDSLRDERSAIGQKSD
jgi:hypothetical protein